MKDIYEIKRANTNELLTAAKDKLKEFPILRDIYDDEFLIELSRNKADRTNVLLFWLVNSLTTKNFLREIENNLKLFRTSGDYQIFKQKLRVWRTAGFESALAELEYSADYLRKGFFVELEPLLPNNKKGDFCIVKDSLKIYFEIKTIFSGESIENDAIISDITDRCSGIKHNFRISINFGKDFRLNDTIAFSKWLKKELNKIKVTPINPPISLNYVDAVNHKATVNLKQLPGGDGYIGGFVYGGGIKSSWTDIRGKIVSGISQLHPSYPGVIVVRPYGLSVHEHDILNALFGDLKIRFNATKSEVIRGGDRIFSPSKNKRLSAVIYENNSGNTNRKFVYHNSFATNKIPYETFEGDNVTQFP